MESEMVTHSLQGTRTILQKGSGQDLKEAILERSMAGDNSDGLFWAVNCQYNW